MLRQITELTLAAVNQWFKLAARDIEDLQQRVNGPKSLAPDRLVISDGKPFDPDERTIVLNIGDSKIEVYHPHKGWGYVDITWV